MDAQGLKKLLLLIVIFIALTSGFVTLAQDRNVLQPLTPVIGLIEPGGTQDWLHIAQSGSVWSFIVESETDGFDPIITIRNSDGEVVIANDDYDYTVSETAMLEAVTMPRTDTYEVVVSGFADSSGEYSLTMLPGYVQIAFAEPFDAAGDWKALTEGLTADVSDGSLELQIAGIDTVGVAYSADTPFVDDFYAEVRIAEINARLGWTVGLTIRQQNTDVYYLALLNDQGFWRFLVHTVDGFQVLRDWTTHPAIRPGVTTFTMGVLARGGGFDLFYDSQFVGQVSDATIKSAGGVGVVAGTASAIGSENVTRIDSLYITKPLLVNGRVVLPQRLVLGSPNATAKELERRHLIPAGGELVLTIDESTARDVDPGVSRFILGRGQTYENFVLGSLITLQASSDGLGGCGLVVRNEDDTHYTVAYIDRMGSYGLAQRNGEAFRAGIFGDGLAQNTNSHHLLVIASGDTMYYYVDGVYRGALDNPAVAGEIGNAVVNFDPIDTTCQFQNMWLWRWTE
jgi:hypothetical protein